MIDADKRNAAFLLHQEGMSAREIARRLGLGRNTLHRMLALSGAMPSAKQREKQPLDAELLQRLYTQCDGWIQRVQEKLAEEEGVRVAYQTLTRKLRALGIGAPRHARCERVPDAPGVEMQHDTSTYAIELGGKPVRLIASLMYLRYSKRRYLKFYRAFNRFKMKCFLQALLGLWGDLRLLRMNVASVQGVANNRAGGL